LTRKKKTTYAMSRRGRNLAFAVVLLSAVLLVWLDRGPLWRRWQTPPKSGSRAEADDNRKYHGKPFTVVNVVDGDTIDIDMPDGKYERTRIRLWGIDTPETRSTKYGSMYFGREAGEFAKKLTLGKRVTVYLDEGNNTRGKYGRLLAYVRLPDDGFLNEVLLTEGFAYADRRFRHSLYNKYKQLESLARSQKKGLWEHVTREQLPPWLQEREPNLLLKK
jgi:endonuclease YncB( thermonuclease family)